jgi:hypothetical protein
MDYLGMFFNNIHKRQYTVGLFLLILSISGNFIAETLSCQTQKILSHNMFVKQIMILFMIYFTINFTSSEIINPIDQAVNAVGVWVFFLMFTKMNIYFTVIVFLLLASLYVVKNFKEYWKSKKDKAKYDKTVKMGKMIEKIMIVTACIGFILYFIKQHKEHKSKFSFIKFIFGKERCDHN